MDALDRVVGISAYTKRPEQALQIPKASGFKFGSVDRIKRVNPDLAILISVVQKDLAVKLAEAGIHTLHLQPHRLQDLFHTIILLGNVVGKPHEAEILNRELQQEMEDIRQQATKLPWHPRIYFEEWMDPMTCGTAWVSDIIELAGGQDVFRGINVEGRKAQSRVVHPEQLVKASPDIVLASWCGKPFVKKDFISRNGFAEIPAVSRDAVYEVDSLILQFGPMLIDSIREVHQLIKVYVER